jgi:hypothetical protein
MKPKILTAVVISLFLSFSTANAQRSSIEAAKKAMVEQRVKWRPPMRIRYTFVNSNPRVRTTSLYLGLSKSLKSLICHDTSSIIILQGQRCIKEARMNYVQASSVALKRVNIREMLDSIRITPVEFKHIDIPAERIKSMKREFKFSGDSIENLIQPLITL